VELLTGFAALLRWFKAAELLTARELKELDSNWAASARARHTVQAMLDFREKLRSQLLTWEAGRSISSAVMGELNTLMGQYPMLSRIKTVRDLPAVELWFEKNEPEQLFAPIVHHAAMLFAHADPSRVRKCDNCILHFLDTSKKGTRRWCSMQLCGNRFKVAAYAARQRQ
jgi:predicted RNA-binding Zn ribbon-like protein